MVGGRMGSEEQTPIRIRLGDDVFEPSDQDTDRGRMLAEDFLEQDYRRYSYFVTSGEYVYNMVDIGTTKIRTFYSEDGRLNLSYEETKSGRSRYEFNYSADSKITQIQIGGGSSGFDWLNPWNFVKFCAVLFLATYLLLEYVF